MLDIERVYRMLKVDNSRDIINEGGDMADKIEDLTLLICPPSDASVWEQCADILSQKNDEELEPYLEALLKWLYDPNWPGALVILERLAKFPDDILQPHVEKAVINALYDGKEGERWLYSLYELMKKS